METVYDRTQLLIGEKGINSLKNGAVIVFGLGGVGGMTVEALARAGVGSITIVDFDVINVTNINRQIIALKSTIGKDKTDVMKCRIRDINPNIKVTEIHKRITPENIHTFVLQNYDFIVDAIDDVPAKIALIETAYNLNVPIVSSMGTGDKIDPEKLSLQKIKTTNTCPLAKVMRGKLKKMGIDDLVVVCSTEKPSRAIPRSECKETSSISFVPATAGLLLAKQVVVSIINKEGQEHEGEFHPGTSKE